MSLYNLSPWHVCPVHVCHHNELDSYPDAVNWRVVFVMLRPSHVLMKKAHVFLVYPVEVCFLWFLLNVRCCNSTLFIFYYVYRSRFIHHRSISATVKLCTTYVWMIYTFPTMQQSHQTETSEASKIFIPLMPEGGCSLQLHLPSAGQVKMLFYLWSTFTDFQIPAFLTTIFLPAHSMKYCSWFPRALTHIISYHWRKNKKVASKINNLLEIQ